MKEWKIKYHIKIADGEQTAYIEAESAELAIDKLRSEWNGFMIAVSGIDEVEPSRCVYSPV